MERRYELRLEQMLAQTDVSPELMRSLLERLETFVEPFATSLDQPERRRHAAESITGLLSKLPRKSGEAIAYLHDHRRQGLQNFSARCPGTTSRCWPPWPARSARNSASPMP